MHTAALGASACICVSNSYLGAWHQTLRVNMGDRVLPRWCLSRDINI
jgi:hypothetical protein